MVDIIAKESPFSPGKPVQPEYFLARTREIQRLERAIKQTLSGRNENVFITGQRGIGKSSIASLIRFLADKEYGLVGSHCFLGGVRSLEDAMGFIFARLLQDCTDKSLFDKLREMFRDYIEGVTLFGTGIQFTKNKGKLTILVDNFLPALRKMYAEAKESGKKGLLLILDDLNGISDVPQFSQFLKSFVDTLATSGKPLPILLILVGLPERRDELIRHQPSVARIFDVIELPLMSTSESEEFFSKMFSQRNMNISSEAMSLMVKFSAGFPMLMHEVGDAIFWTDKDGFIDEDDCFNGIPEAAASVGKRYIDPKVHRALKTGTYSSILFKMGVIPPLGRGVNFRRSEILGKATAKERKNLDNFLKRMKKLGVITEGEMRGEYSFVNPLYYLYLWSWYAKNVEDIDQIKKNRKQSWDKHL